MAAKRDWVDYTNLAANVVQTAQLDGINNKMRQMAALELQKEYREQQEVAVAKCEDLLRDAVFFYSEQLRDLADLAKSNPVAAYIRANHLKRMYKFMPHFKASKFRKYEDKERLTNLQREYDGFISNSAQQLSLEEVELSDRCITYIFEREELVQMIEAMEKHGKSAVMQESIANQIASKLGALQKIRDEQERNHRPFWKKIFDGGKSELDNQAVAVELEIRSLNQDVKNAKAKFSVQDTKRYNSVLKKFSGAKCEDYKKLLSERDALMKHMLGEFVKGLLGEDYYASLDSQLPFTARHSQQLCECVPPTNTDGIEAQSALAEWIRIGNNSNGVYIFGPNLPNGGYCAKDYNRLWSDFEKTGLLSKGGSKRSTLIDEFVSMGYTFIVIEIPGEILVIGSVPIAATTDQKERVIQFLGLDLHQKVQCRKTQSSNSRVLDVNYVLYGG